MSEEKGPCSIVSALSYAVSEWLLMLLLFIDGLFSYMITRFAQYCNLQSPCLFCSRLDHALGAKDKDFYERLICSSHKLEISSWAYCRLHRRLVDVLKICEPCLLSSANEENNLEAYISSVRKVLNIVSIDRSYPTEFSASSVSHEECLHDAKVPHYFDLALGFLKNSHCSCCNNHLRMKLHTDIDGVEPSGAVSGLIEHSLKHPVVSHCKNHNFEPLSHSGTDNFEPLPCSEPEVAASNDGCGQANAMINSVFQPTGTGLYSFEAKVPSQSSITEKQSSTSPTEAAALVSAQADKYPAKEQSGVVSLVKTPSRGHESDEFIRYEVQDREPSLRSDIIHSQASPDFVTPNGMEIADVLSSSSTCGAPNALDSDEVISKHSTKNANELHPTMSDALDLNDMYKMVISNKRNEKSPKEPSQLQEDLKLLLSQLSSAGGLDFYSNDVISSPRVHEISEETKAFDGSCSSCMQIINRRFSIERNQSGLSSLDGSAFSEIEGESAVNRLKRLVEFKKRSSFLLYKELEEERNASAIAINQAMAMITRLQEEKAAMQMEALQYQRMMEEQAEYDHAELQKSYDLLSEREKELSDLKEEFVMYKKLMGIHKGDGALSLITYVDDGKSSHNKRE